MKTIFKITPVVLFTMFIFMITSCKKDPITPDPAQEIKLRNKTAVTPETPPPGGGLGSYVYLNANGEYATSYAGGITFGNTFTYPLSVQSYQNGTPYTPFYNGGYSPANMLSWTQHGSSFVMLLGTVVGGLPIYDNSAATQQGMQNYNADVARFLNGELTVMPTLPDHMSRVGGSADGIITITGTFVLDTASPTHVSVTNITYLTGSVE